MKKIFATALAFLLIFALVGCSEPTYKLPWDHFCYLASDGSPIELEPKEKQYIINLLNDGDWYGALANCPTNIKFASQKQSIGYSTEKGIFNDFTLQKSLTISEDEKNTVNGYLGFN